MHQEYISVMDSSAPRVVVVGAGRMGMHHVRTILRNSHLALAGILERDIGRHADLRSQAACGVDSNLARLVDQVQPVGAIIATPDDTHLELSLEALDLGLHLLVEKQASNPVGIIKQYHACLEKVDIGGPTLLRAAAKGGRYAIATPELLESTLRHLQGGSAIYDTKFRNSLAAMAEMTVSTYAMTAFGFYQSLVDGTFPEKFQK
jgi:hypothetical protein